MAIPDFQTLMLPVLRAAAVGEIRIGDVVERLAGEFRLTEDERAHLLPSGRQTTSPTACTGPRAISGRPGWCI